MRPRREQLWPSRVSYASGSHASRSQLQIVNPEGSRAPGISATPRDAVDAWRSSVDRFIDLETRQQRHAWIEYAASICHPDIEWDLTEFAHPPNVPIVLYGIDAVRSFWQHWLEAWVPLGLEYEMVEAGDSVVMLVEKERFRARATGSMLTMPPYAQRAKFENGLMVTWKAYATQEGALEAAWG
jgi:hypothetical protein